MVLSTGDFVDVTWRGYVRSCKIIIPTPATYGTIADNMSVNGVTVTRNDFDPSVVTIVANADNGVWFVWVDPTPFNGLGFGGGSPSGMAFVFIPPVVVPPPVGPPGVQGVGTVGALPEAVLRDFKLKVESDVDDLTADFIAFQTLLGNAGVASSEFGRIFTFLNAIKLKTDTITNNVNPTVNPGGVNAVSNDPNVGAVDLDNSYFSKNMFNILRAFGSTYGYTSLASGQQVNYNVVNPFGIDANFVSQVLEIDESLEVVVNETQTNFSRLVVCDDVPVVVSVVPASTAVDSEVEIKDDYVYAFDQYLSNSDELSMSDLSDLFDPREFVLSGVAALFYNVEIWGSKLTESDFESLKPLLAGVLRRVRRNVRDSFVAQMETALDPTVLSDVDVTTVVARDVESVSSSFGSTSVPRPVDDKWNYTDVLCRPMLIDSGTIAYNFAGKGYLLPQEWMFAVTHASVGPPATPLMVNHRGRLSDVFNAFALARYDLVVRLHVNTNHFYGGDVGLAFDYGNRHTLELSTGTTVPHRGTLSCLHHALMDLSMGNEIELRIPFVSICDSISKNGNFYSTPFLGTVYLFHTLGLSHPSSVPNNVRYSVFVYAEKPVLDSITQYSTPHDLFMPQGFEQSMLKNVTAGNFSFAGLDKTSMRLALSDVSNSGVVNSDVVDLLEIARKPSLLSTFTWTGTSTYMQDLSAWYNHPLTIYNGVSYGTTRSSYNLVGAVCRLFSYWSGSLIYHIKFGASQFHSGRVVVAYFPLEGTSGADSHLFYDVPHMFIDIKEKHEFKFVVPFVSATSMRPMAYKQIEDGVFHIHTGTVKVIVLDPMVSPNGSTENISVSVWISVGPDFRVSVPRDLRINKERFISQGLDDGAELGTVLGRMPMSRISTLDSDVSCLMSLARRFSSCIGRFTTRSPKYMTGTGNAARYANSVSFPVNPSFDMDHRMFPLAPVGGNPGVVQSREVSPSILHYLSRFFTMWRGDLKYKICVQSTVRTNSIFVRVSHDPTLFLNQNFPVDGLYKQFDAIDSRSGLAITILQTGKENICEIEVPFYSMYNSLYVTGHENYTYRDTGYPVGSTSNGSINLDWMDSESVEISVYIAAGDNFQFLVPNGYVGDSRNKAAQSTYNLDTPFVAQGAVVECQGLFDGVTGVDTVRLNDVVRKVDDVMPMVAGSAVNISALSSRLVELMPTVESLLKGGAVATDFLQKVQSFCANIGVYVSEKADTVRSLLNKLCADAPLCGVEPMILILCLGFAYYISRQEVSYLTLFSSVVVALLPLAVTQFGRDFTMYVCKNIQSLLNLNDDDTKAQGNDFSFDVTPKLVVHLLLAGIAIVVYKVVPGYNDVHKLLKESGDLGRQCTGVKSGIKMAEEMGESISGMLMSVLATVYGPDDVAVNSINLLLKFDVMKWLSDVAQYSLLENRFTEFSSPERITHIRLLYDRVSVLREAMAQGEFHVGLATQVTSAIRDITKLRDEIYQYKGLDVSRIDPFHVCFMGKPGVGKSALMSKFVHNMLQFRGEPLTDAVYSRSPANKYWDGYRNELVTTFDDLAAVADTATPTDVTEMINLKSNAPTQVVMAHLDDKGKHFTSKYIVSTTNVKMLSSDSMLRCADAFHRRRDVLLDVIRVGPIGTTAEEEESASHLAFVLYDSLTGNPIGSQMSYSEMFEMVMRRCEVYMQGQERLLKSYKTDTFGSKLRDQISRSAEESLFTFPVNHDLELVDPTPGILNPIVCQGEAGESVVGRAICESMYFDVKGKVCFSDSLTQEAFEQLDRDSQVMLVNRVKSMVSSVIESLDVAAVLAGVTDPMSKLLMRQCLKGAKLVNDELVCDNEDVEEAYATFSPREQCVFVNLVKMEKLIQDQQIKSEISAKRISKVKSYVESCWSKLSDDQKSLFRLAMGAGVFVAVVGTIYGVSRKLRAPVSNVIDNSVFESKSVSLDNVVVPSSEMYVCEMSEDGDVSGAFVPEEDSPAINDRVAKRKKKFVARSKFAWMGNMVREGLDVIPESSTLEVGQTKEKSGVAGRKGLTWKKVDESLGAIEVEPALSLRPQKPYVQKESGFGNFNTKGESFKSAVRKEVDAVLEFNANPIVKNVGKVVSQGATFDLVEITDVRGQSARDNEAQDLIVKSLVHNLGMILYKSGDKAFKMQCTFITDSIVCAPWHFFNKIKHGDLFYVQVGPVKYEIRFDKTQLYRLGMDDCCLYRCGSRVPKVRSLVGRIARRSDHEDFYATSGTLVNCSYEDNFLQMRLHCVSRVGSHTERVLYDVGEDSRQELKGYGYMANTQNGECGSPLVVDRPGSVRKIFGMHAAANTVTKKGYSVKLVAEDIEAGIEYLCPVNNCEVEGLDFQAEVDKGTFSTDVTNAGMSDLPDGNISYVGVVPKSMATRVPKKTGIRASRLNGLVAQVRTEPAILDKNDPRLEGKEFNPLVSGIAKYGISSVPWFPEQLKQVEDYLVNKLKNVKSSRGDKGPLALDQIINGIPGLEYYDAMNMKSSEGYPFIKDRVGMQRGKKHLFKEVGEMSNGAPKYEIDSSKLREMYNNRIREAECGRRVWSISQECTKDERVKLAKIYNVPKTRTFSIMPCDYTMATRRYFMDFCVAIMANRRELPIKVGINPMSLEWTELFMQMSCVSPLGFAADYKTFDGQGCGDLFNMLCRVINTWYNDSSEAQAARQVLMNEISKRVTICEDTLLQIENGLPSGVSLTVILNSLLNWVYLALAWLNLAPNEYRDLAEFDRLTALALYGDDNNCAVDEEVIEWYNLATVGAYLARHGVVITDDAKRGYLECRPFWEIKNFTFLKREFKRHHLLPFFMLAPLDEVSIWERVMWYRKGGDDLELLYNNIENSLEDAFHHGKEFYTIVKNNIDDNLMLLDLPASLHSYDEAELRWYAAIELPFEPEFLECLEMLEV